LNLPEQQANRAYAKSLAALEYLRETYGMGEICQMLKLMASKPSSSILQQELQLDYPHFEEEVTAYLVKRYGKP
jgi:hypothetical protein